MNGLNESLHVVALIASKYKHVNFMQNNDVNYCLVFIKPELKVLRKERKCFAHHHLCSFVPWDA